MEIGSNCTAAAAQTTELMTSATYLLRTGKDRRIECFTGHRVSATAS
jgi:hypothetical protein